jgi:hypothetical protein
VIVGTTRYRGLAYDSARWEHFDLRAGDVVISTPPKCGTTWTQMICALLVFQEPDLPAPLGTLSPWIDMLLRPQGEVFADLGAQRHRRFIKTHTPLDGLPFRTDVTYLCTGRDPRDVAVSMDHHLDNLDVGHVLQRREATAVVDALDPASLLPPRARPADRLERFRRWVDDETPVTVSGSTLRFTLHHLRTFWDAPDDLDVVLLHYDDLTGDLAGEMRRLADHLGIVVPDDVWPGLVRAATFDEMRSHPEVTVPGGSRGQWKDPTVFFRRGTSGQWRELLDEPARERYAQVVQRLVPADLSAWLHRPPVT